MRLKRFERWLDLINPHFLFYFFSSLSLFGLVIKLYHNEMAVSLSLSFKSFPTVSITIAPQPSHQTKAKNTVRRILFEFFIFTTRLLNCERDYFFVAYYMHLNLRSKLLNSCQPNNQPNQPSHPSQPAQKLV